MKTFQNWLSIREDFDVGSDVDPSEVIEAFKELARKAKNVCGRVNGLCVLKGKIPYLNAHIAQKIIDIAATNDMEEAHKLAHQIRTNSVPTDGIRLKDFDLSELAKAFDKVCSVIHKKCDIIPILEKLHPDVYNGSLKGLVAQAIIDAAATGDTDKFVQTYRKISGN
jgi:hypothetical protein